jgi:hypothetical protein
MTDEKRITDLINLRIISKTEKVFLEETTLLRKSTNFMRRVTIIANKAIASFDEQPNLRAVMDLFCRNRDIVHFSIVCMINGGYSETKILSRVAMENFLLIRLFNMKPNLAKYWFSNPEEFRKDWKPEEIRKTVFAKFPRRTRSYSEFYGLLCDYSHPSFEGWIELMKKVDSKVFIGCRPEFNADYASECIGLIYFIIMQSIKGFEDAFKEWFTKELLSEANLLMPKINEMISRHFEVRKYDKRKMIS